MWRLLRILLLAGTLACLVAPLAQAAESYTLEHGTAGCSGGSGQVDEQGRLYVPCNGAIQVRSPAGALLQTIGMGALDVAPSPDGHFVYVMTGWGGSVTRLVRAADGSYSTDAGYATQQFAFAGAMHTIRTSHIATDAWGNLYVAEGYWVSQGLETIAKFAPDGSFVTRFGTFTEGSSWDDPRHFALGSFYWGVAGLTVSRDGRHVYASEVGNNRVQRFDWQPNGDYRPTLAFGNTLQDVLPHPDDPSTQADESRDDSASCAPGKMAAPYDLGIDGWGFVYVANTTCSQVQKFTPDGQFLYAMYVGDLGPDRPGSGRDHYIAVDAHGSVVNTEGDNVMRRTSAEPGPWPAPEPLPAPDRTAPVVTSVTAPASSYARTITVAIGASDDRGVTELRLAGDDGAWSAWQPYAAQFGVTLPAAFGTHAVSVQVRDAAGNESNAATRTVDYRADDIAPVLDSVGAPATTYAQTIDLTVAAHDNVAVAQLRVADASGTWGPWQPYAQHLAYTLPAFGTHVVTMQVRDARGNESNTVTRTVAYRADDTAPVLASISAPATTSVRVVAVGVAATDNVAVTQVRVADESGTWQPWQAYAPSVSYTLTTGHGAKGVFVQVRDAAGNESAVLYRAITVPAAALNEWSAATGALPALTRGGAGDATAPTLVRVQLVRASRSRRATVVVRAGDDVAVTGVRLADARGGWGAWRRFGRSLPVTLPAGRGCGALSVQVRDAAGNESRVVTVRFSCATRAARHA